jgi:hypothetical protein
MERQQQRFLDHNQQWRDRQRNWNGGLLGDR